MKRAIAIIILILTIGGIGALSYFSEKTYFNDEGEVGNTSGNLLNGGIFSEDSNLIYFSNPNDNGALYSMDLNCENFKKLHSDNVSYINSAGKYIIYVRNNQKRNKANGDFFNFNSTGIYRVDKKGNNIKTLYDDPAKLTSLKGNYVYYQHYNPEDGLKFYRVKIDGTEEEKISDEAIIPSSFLNDSLYFNGEKNDHNIYVMDTNNMNRSLLYEGNCYNPIATDNYIYFLSLNNNYAVVRINRDGTNPKMLVDERVSFFNLSQSGKYLYYQVDGGDNNRLCKLNLETLKSKTLLEGDYNSIHVTSNFVFFQEFSSKKENGIKKTYRMSVRDDSISVFNPPIIKD